MVACVQLVGTVQAPEEVKVCDPGVQEGGGPPVIVVGSATFDVGTVAVTPPPVTFARLVTLPGALLATFTASVMAL